MNKNIHVPTADFQDRLAAARANLSPKMARIAAYISDNTLKAAFMTTTELAAAAGVSLATAVRFPLALGYADFGAFRGAIQDRVSFDLTSVERIHLQASSNRSSAALLRRIIDADMENLRALAQSFSEPQLDHFVSAIQAAERVSILGFRFVSPLTRYFVYSLEKIRFGVRGFEHSDSTLYDRIRAMNDGDVLIVIAFARYPSDIIALTRYAQTRNVRILAITDSPLSPLLPHAETALFARSPVLDFVGSLGAPAALINCIVSELGVRMGDEALKRLKLFEDVAQSAGIYVRGSFGKTDERRLAWDTEKPVGSRLKKKKRS